MKKFKISSELLFIIMILITIITTYILRNIQFSISNKEYFIFNFISKEGLDYILTNIVKNFMEFKVLGIVLIVALGVGVAEETEFLNDLLISIMKRINDKYLIPLILFIGIISNVAGSISFVIVPTLAGIIFKVLKRNPIIGIITGFAGVASGLSANIFLAPTDILASTITQVSTNIYISNYKVLPTSNYYFFFISTFVLVIFGSITINKITIKMVEKYKINEEIVENEEYKNKKYSRRGLIFSLLSVCLYILFIIIILLPKNSILRSEDGSIMNSPFINGLIIFITILFLIPGIVYGIFTKKIINITDIFKIMSNSIKKYSNFIVLCFFASQFIALFKKSNLGMYIVYRFSNFLINNDINIYLFVIIFIFFISIINFFVGSMSAKWIIISPIVIPLFLKMNLTPEFAQLSYRIADSTTNTISPLEPFMPFILGLMNTYSTDIEMKDVIKLMFPISITFLVVFIIQILIFMKYDLAIGIYSYIFK